MEVKQEAVPALTPEVASNGVKSTMPCPACRENGSDKSGNHLTVFPGGKFSCVVYLGNTRHNQRIIQLRPELGAAKPRKGQGPIRWANSTPTKSRLLATIPEHVVEDGVRATLVCSYFYEDVDRKPLYATARYAMPACSEKTKTFRQYAIVEGGFLDGMKGAHRVPYCLPRVVDADTVFIVEGEKDADRLNALGFVATTNAGGAGKWQASWAPFFKGKDVVIFPDNDTPGQNHADQVAASLLGVAASMRRVAILTPAKDISDVLAGTSDTEAPAAVQVLLKLAQKVSGEGVETSVEATSDSRKSYPANDQGNARRFVEHVRERIRYVPARKAWMVWDEQHWKIDGDGAIYRMAETHSIELLRKSANITDGDLRDREAKLALHLGRRAVIENMLALARYNECVILPAERLDSDPLLLGVRNGVIDLATGLFRDGTYADYISNRVGCDYVRGATCPQFDAFLLQVMANDPHMISYLWRIIGYCLTGLTTEQCLFFLHGSGRNGKSTFIDVLTALLGDYGRATAVELITDSQHGREPSQLIAALQGKRLVCLPEVEDTHRIAQSRLKTLTGGDRLCGRNLYEKEFEFDCTAKLLIHGNTCPEVRGTDLGIWRRFRLIPFAVTIPANEVDYDLVKKLIVELPGILNRAVEACLDWGRAGMQTPQMVESATNDYREAEDILRDFLDESTVQCAAAEVAKSLLYEAYLSWCNARSQHPLTTRRFGGLLAQRGIKERRASSTRYWLGISVK